MVQFEPDDGSQRRDSMHHHGTIAADGTSLFDDPWGGFTDITAEITGFGGAYPFPGFPPAFDPSASASRATTTDAGNDGTTSGPSETIQATQAPNDAPPSGLVIIANYDTTITDLFTSNPTLYSEITGAVTAAIDFYEAAIANPITISIGFGYGEVGGIPLDGDDLGESLTEGSAISYNELRALLEGHDTSTGASPLPVTDPLSGSSIKQNWLIADSELLALGMTPNLLGNDGFVGLSSTLAFTYNPNDRAVSGEYDAIGVLEHEISEAMGRVADYPGGEGLYSALDLFRYTAPGTLATDGTAAYFSINGGNTNLDAFDNNLANSGDAGDWASSVPNDSYDAFSNTGVANTVSATDLTVMKALGYTLAAACYAAGTRILTARGEVRVEKLAAGELVQTRFAGLTPIKWIGHRRIDCRRHHDPRQVWPVRVVAGAFGPDQPCRDLFLSPDHAVAVDRALIPIRLLVNGASICQEAGVPWVHYFHIELDRHDLLLADGLAAESFLDTGNRGMFANAGMPTVLHPTPEGPAAQYRRETMSCLTLRSDPTYVEPVWRALAARTKSLGLALPVVETTYDPALCVVAGARRFTPVVHGGGRYTFVLPTLPDGARLRSRYAAPSEVRPWMEDRRRLGVMVCRITLRSGADVVEIAPDDSRLTDGWWAAEHDVAALWRWTDGDAALPSTNDFTILEVSIGETPLYPLAEPACAGPTPGARLAARVERAMSATGIRSAA